jgi:DNA primase
MTNWGIVLLDAGINVPQYETEFNIPCPLHSDRVASCAINLDKGVWICFAGCGSGSLQGLLVDFLGVPRLKIDSMIMDSSTKIFDVNMFDEFEENAVKTYDLQGNAKRLPNWAMEDRGFEIRSLVDWGCRLAEENGLEIPVRDMDNRIVGSITRRPLKEPKYLYSKGLPKSKILFGAERIKESVPCVFIVEGALDAIWLHQHGYNAVALLGMNLSKQQGEILRRVRTSEIVIATDNDEAGRRAGESIRACISGSFVVSYIELPVEAKDVQDIRNADDLHRVLMDRNYW